MIEGIISFFQALPAFLTFISKLGTVLEAIMKEVDQNNLNQWVNDLEATVDQLKKSKTPEEKLDAATRLARIMRGIGPR